jgi:hypothetical protein
VVKSAWDPPGVPGYRGPKKQGTRNALLGTHILGVFRSRPQPPIINGGPASWVLYTPFWWDKGWFLGHVLGYQHRIKESSKAKRDPKIRCIILLCEITLLLASLSYLAS